MGKLTLCDAEKASWFESTLASGADTEHATVFNQRTIEFKSVQIEQKSS